MTSYAPPRPSPLVPGYRLDRYELLCPIAEGGMGAVWLARQRGKHGFQKLVAIKTILPHILSEPDVRRLFLDEARLASRIDHTNVAQVLDLGEEHDVLYLVLEWVDGDSLHKLAKVVAEKSLVLPQAILLRVLSDACLGLHAAHELRDDAGKHLGVVHRDVSPQNILVSAHGTGKLIDFGIAKARDRLTQETRMGVVKGKLEYMSPEQALGRDVDVRADIWAVGAVFYRIVTGNSPYEASSPVSTLELLAAGKLPIPVSAIPGVHPAVCKVIERALAPRAAERFATAAEMHDALQAALTKAGVCASAKEVQAFVATHLGERIGARKRAIQVALEAAEHREKLAAVLKPATLESSGTIAIAGDAASPASPGFELTSTSITRRERLTKVDEHTKKREVKDADAGDSLATRRAPLGGTVVVQDALATPGTRSTPTSITRRDGATRAVNDAPTGPSVPRHAPLGRAETEPIAARLQARRIRLAFVLVLGTGSVLGALDLVRAWSGASSSPTAAKVIDSAGATPPAPPAVPRANLSPSAQATAAEVTGPRNDPPSPRAPTSPSTEPARQGVVPLPGPAHSRLSPRSGTTSPRHPAEDSDGI